MQCNKKLNKNNSGFSLIELIVTVVILALVTAPFLSSFVTASRTNLKAKRIEAANEISQEIIERFKGSDVEYIKNLYGMTSVGGSPDVSSATIDCDGTLVNGYKGYTAKIELTGGTSVSAANGDSPIIDKIESDACAFISSGLFQSDGVAMSSYPSVTKRKVEITISYVPDVSNPADSKYVVKTDVSYMAGATIKYSIPGFQKESSVLPAIYIAYKPLSDGFDEVYIKNDLTDTQLGGNKLPIYLVNQETYGKLDPSNVHIIEGVADYNLRQYNHEPTYMAADLSKSTLNTNILTNNYGAPGINKVVTSENIDYLYTLKVDIMYDSKLISSFTASKNRVY